MLGDLILAPSEVAELKTLILEVLCDHGAGFSDLVSDDYVKSIANDITIAIVTYLEQQ